MWLKEKRQYRWGSSYPFGPTRTNRAGIWHRELSVPRNGQWTLLWRVKKFIILGCGPKQTKVGTMSVSFLVVQLGPVLEPSLLIKLNNWSPFSHLRELPGVQVTHFHAASLGFSAYCIRFTRGLTSTTSTRVYPGGHPSGWHTSAVPGGGGWPPWGMCTPRAPPFSSIKSVSAIPWPRSERSAQPSAWLPVQNTTVLCSSR